MINNGSTMAQSLRACSTQRLPALQQEVCTSENQVSTIGDDLALALLGLYARDVGQYLQK